MSEQECSIYAVLIALNSKFTKKSKKGVGGKRIENKIIKNDLPYIFIFLKAIPSR